MVESDEEDSEAAILFSPAKWDLCTNKPAKNTSYNHKSTKRQRYNQPFKGRHNSTKTTRNEVRMLGIRRLTKAPASAAEAR